MSRFWRKWDLQVHSKWRQQSARLLLAFQFDSLDASNSPNKEGATAHALWYSLQVRTLCTESSCSQAHTTQHACGERFARALRHPDSVYRQCGHESFACPLALFSARQARTSEQQEIAFRSTGSVSDFSATPDGISGRLYWTSVLDISMARASEAIPPGHLPGPGPLYSKWYKTHKGVPLSACCEEFAKQVLDQGPLDSGHQGKSEICNQRADKTSDHGR